MEREGRVKAEEDNDDEELSKEECEGKELMEVANGVASLWEA